MRKLKERLKQIHYYIIATVTAGAVFGGLKMVGDKKEVVANNQVVRCFLGDMGNDNEGQKLVANKMHSEGCDELYHLGDNVYPTGIKSADDKDFQRKWYGYYEDFNMNVMVMGNHDHYGNIEAWLELSDRYDNIHYPSHFYIYKSNDVCTVVWNSEIVERADDSEFVKKQAEYIDGIDLSLCKIKISASHHPLFSSGNHGNAKKPVAEFYEKHIIGKFNYAFSGHDHSLEDTGTYKGTRFIVSGAGSELRKCKSKSRGQCWAKLGFVKMIDNGEPEFIFVEE